MLDISCIIQSTVLSEMRMRLNNLNCWMILDFIIKIINHKKSHRFVSLIQVFSQRRPELKKVLVVCPYAD